MGVDHFEGVVRDRQGKLYVTVFNGEGGMQRDAEAYDLWAAQGVPKKRIFEMGLKTISGRWAIPALRPVQRDSLRHGAHCV